MCAHALLLNIVNITPAPMSSVQAFGNSSTYWGFTVILCPPNMMEKKPPVLRSVSSVAELRKQAGIIPRAINT